MSSNFLLEIGTEELPSSFVRQALQSMEQSAQTLLKDARLADGVTLQTLGTPRRLAIRFEGLPASQEDRNELVVGPPWNIAFEDDGTPKKAAAGFAKKQGVAVGDLKKHATDKGDYVSAQVSETGRPTTQVLSELLPTLCDRISFPKSMRWGPGEVAFGRPIHWIVALLDDEVVPFDFAGIQSGRSTRGHRFLAPDAFELASSGEYEEALEKAHVIVNTERRRAMMCEALENAAKELGGVLQHDEFLVGECLSLVEKPFVVPGRFEEAYLALPDEVVVSVMRDHQRYFAVREAKGALMPVYLNVVNTAGNPEKIALGNDRVLRARLADAQFFVEEDQKAPLKARLTKLDTVVFQSKLGSMGDKVRRVVELSRTLAAKAGASEAHVTDAATLCKADLETLIVYEFPELQGEMGRWYAQREGLDDRVADAIADHYKPKGASDDVPTQPVSAVVAVADRLDTLVGCFGAGLEPTGSADPFALRRAALGVIRIALEGPIDVHLADALAAGLHGYDGNGKLRPATEVADSLNEFFRGRIRVLRRDRYPADVVDACLGAWDGGSLRDLDARMNAVSDFRNQPEYGVLATAFKRAFNITKESERGPVDKGLLESGPEADLADNFQAARAELDGLIQDQAYDDALRAIAAHLAKPIDTFFEEVFVMVDDEALRDNRLRLLGEIADTVNQIAHFHQLST